ncbi:lantibiotic dehydratase (plasmid) [Streptomyces sp. NBC_01216]|uniref:lantibiotic dehydratase n=1 Tax=Streptomyces sp. NBC_01216 TaxID=2903778 RepID=UPI002E0DE1FE|nr:lantibiotic dehydratase [Streptomyces sp. NBC_01216]
MSTASNRLRFVSAPPALLRAVCHPSGRFALPPVPSASGTPDEAQAWIQQAWVLTELRDMVQHASPDLARSLDALTAQGGVDPDRIRGMLLALAAYCQRAVNRPVPFGLFTGVLEASFGTAPVAQWGEEHQAVARAGSQWLTDIIGRLEAMPRVRERLWLVSSNVAARRGGRLVVPWQQRRLDVKGTEVHEVSLRLEPEVRVLTDLAASPVPYSDLLHKIRAEFPEHSESAVRGLLDELVARRVLITSLQPSAMEIDALGYVLRELARVDADRLPEAADLVGALASIHRLMAAHNQTAGQAQGPLRAQIRERMAPHVPGDDQPVALDVLLDGTVVLPHEVAREAEKAAEMLARISPEPDGHEAWTDYCRRFLDHYGPGMLVPLLELTGPTGLGLPDGYHTTPTAGTAWHRMCPRDAVLLATAQHATLTGEDIVLDDELAERIAVGTPDATDLPRHLELLFEVHSPSLDALTSGTFTLAVRAASRGWGYLSGGRFAALLATRPSSPLLDELTNRPTSTDGALTAQLSFPGLAPSGVHITRTPRLMPAVIALSEYREPADDLIELSDLAVMCDGQALHLVSRSRQQVIEAGTPHPLQIECQTPALVRFLDELVRGQAVRMTGPVGTLRPMHWGAARHLPVLPRVVTGRSVLSPAMWRLNSWDLPGPRASMAQWEDAMEILREQRGIPDRVLAERFDQRLSLDLTRPGDLALLREQTSDQQFGPLHLVEAPARDAHGWAGRPVEVVTLLRAAGPPRPAPDLSMVIGLCPRAHAIGASRYVQAQLHGPIQGRRDLLADHLPALLADLGDVAWWVRPQNGLAPYLELTVRVDDPETTGAAAGHIGAWAAPLMGSGALRDLILVPYRPHPGRWGDGPLLEAAEAVMAADSAVSVHQAAVSPGAGADLRAEAVVGLLGIVEGFLGGREAGHTWWVGRPKDSTGGRLPRDVQQDIGGLVEAGPDSAAVPYWAARRDALAAYAELVRVDDSIDADRVLDELLHEHCLRTSGPDSRFEVIARRLARAHAMTALATKSRPTKAPPP